MGQVGLAGLIPHGQPVCTHGHVGSHGTADETGR
jgi:hypothetical protein